MNTASTSHSPAGQFYSGTFDTSFLELPNNGMIVKTIEKVPKRPTAKIHLVYDVADDITRCVVEERTDKTDAFKYDGTGFVFPNVSLTSVAAGSVTEAICLSVLQRSDVFCLSQARTDFPKAMKKRAFWEELEQDIKNLHVAASVMLV